MDISEKITKLRKSLGLSQVKFSEAIGISVNTIRAIETKGVTPKSDVLEKISAVWRFYALWLLTEEDAPLAGQFSPIENIDYLNNEKRVYQIIDVVSPRNLDHMKVKPSFIERALFLQTADVPSSRKVERILNNSLYHQDWFAHLNASKDYFCGTAMLLVTEGTNVAGFKQAVLVNDHEFDIREIEQKGGIYGLLGDLKRWFEIHGIRRFEIFSVNHKTLMAARIETDELKVSDLYPAPSDVEKSFISWCESF